jgi:hypothetical protein
MVFDSRAERCKEGSILSKETRFFAIGFSAGDNSILHLRGADHPDHFWFDIPEAPYI